MSDQFHPYYQSHQKVTFIGASGQRQINDAKVLIIGSGGLGCPCLLYLTGCGIGQIGIADFDTISISNLHRQVIFGIEDVGKPKAAVAAQRLAAHNPYITLKDYQLQVNESNIIDLIQDYDIIVDCTDNFYVRYLINDACVYVEKPLVYGAIHQAEGHVTVLNHLNSPTLRCLFPEPDTYEYVPSCAEIGAYNITTSIIGTLMANEVIKIILKNKEVFSGKLICFDILMGKMRHLAFFENPDSRSKSIQRFQTTEKNISITIENLLQLLKDKPCYLIDIREAWERNIFDIGGLHRPLSEFTEDSFSKFLPDDIVVLYCQKGLRSGQVVEQLRKKGLINSFSLHGGVKYCKSFSNELESCLLQHSHQLRSIL